MINENIAIFYGKETETNKWFFDHGIYRVNNLLTQIHGRKIVLIPLENLIEEGEKVDLKEFAELLKNDGGHIVSSDTYYIRNS